MDNDYWRAYDALDCLIEADLISESDTHVVLSIPLQLWKIYNNEAEHGN